MKTEPRQGFPICHKCKNGEMVYRGENGPLQYEYKCDKCGVTKLLGLIPEEAINEN